MIASQSALRALLALDPALATVPAAIASGLLSQAATAPSQGSPAIPAGAFISVAAGPLPVRDAPSTGARELGTLAPFEPFEATGENENYFARGTTAQGVVGWVSGQFLAAASPASQSSVLSAAEETEARLILSSWARANGFDFGQPYDLDATPAAAERMASAVGAFQSSLGLPSTGQVDDKTRAALRDWSSAHAAEVVRAADELAQRAAALANSIHGPTVPTPSPAASASAPSSSGSSTGIMLALGAAAVGLFFVLEEKKKKKAAR